MTESRNPDEQRPLTAGGNEMLAAVRADLAGLTGGASPRAVLAALARQMASDLATYFDELPMHSFAGSVARVGGPLGWLVPRKRVSHRVVAGCYLSTSVARDAGNGWTRRDARIAVLGLGVDGVLRTGVWTGVVTLEKSTEVRTATIDWDDVRMRGVPPKVLSMKQWTGGTDPSEVATPPRVLDALTAIVGKVAADSTRDIALLKRFL